MPYMLPQIRTLVFSVSIFYIYIFLLFFCGVGEIVGKATSLHCVLLRLLYTLEASVMRTDRRTVAIELGKCETV